MYNFNTLYKKNNSLSRSLQNITQEKKIKKPCKKQGGIAFPVDRDFLMGDPLIFYLTLLVILY